MSEPKRTAIHDKTMRGGLGRTLLTAFLLLAIVPLAIMSVYAINQIRQESRQQQEQQLELLAESYRAQLVAAIQRAQQELDRGVAVPQWFLDKDGEPLSGLPMPPGWLDDTLPLSQPQVGGNSLSLWLATPRDGGWAGTVLPVGSILAEVQLPEDFPSTSVYLEQGERFFSPDAGAPALAPEVRHELSQVVRALDEPTTVEVGEGDSGAIVSAVPLTGDLTILLLRPHSAALAAADVLAATLVAAALITALLSTVAAALITRGITQPLYVLTRSAVQIARGDLSQLAHVERDNELGVLALAFNAMAKELKETLDTLEERVELRTRALQEANAQMRRRARQLELTAELGAVLSAIQEQEQLLVQACTLINSAFGYRQTSIWLLSRRNGNPALLELRAASGGESGEETQDQTEALANRVIELGSIASCDDEGHLALPLRLADNVIGVLVICRDTPFTAEEHPPLQILADTITVAIENARASQLERRAMEKLHQIEEHRQRFLGEMSHELSTALNSIIGFSRLMLKEVDGPLTETQRSDLTFINRNGTHLLSLLDGLLDVIEGEQNSGSSARSAGG